MSSISSAASAMMTQSPRAQMNARISAAASAGSISATDASALSGALDTIDSSLSSSGAKPAGDMKSKIDDLIQQQVSSGSLTSDQASELQSFFAQGPNGGNGAPPPSSGDSSQDGASVDGASAAGGVSGARGGGHAHHMHGGRKASATDSTDTSTTDSTDSTDEADETSAQIDALMSFLTKLRDSASANSGTYSAQATTGAATSSATGLVVDTTA